MMKAEQLRLPVKIEQSRLFASSLPTRQQGVALIISMILLAIITILSVSAMRGTNLDAKIAANYQHKQLSFQAAESALAKLTSDDPNVVIPTLATGTLTSADYVTFAAYDGQPANSSDLDLTFVRESAPGEYKLSGFSLSIITLIYTADSYGEVDGSLTKTHNRATVARVRE